MTDYDITFCEGIGCARRNTCHRYLHLLVFRADADPNRGNIVSMTKPTDTTNCGLYWE